MNNTNGRKYLKLASIITTFTLSVVVAGIFATKVVGVDGSPLTPPVTPPVANQAPVIVSPAGNVLPSGKVGVAYRTEILIRDADNERVWTTISGQNYTNLKFVCSIQTNGAKCAIFGTPSKAGTFNVTVKTWDKAKATTTKTFTLTINK